MHTDSFFSQGHTHTVCQDYALSGFDSAAQPFAIVADGCSSSPNSDVGARLLAHAAQQYLRKENAFCPPNVLRQARLVAAALDIPNRCLDSTLGVIRASTSLFEVWLAGDGNIAATRHDGSIDQIHISYPDDHPAYLSYTDDPSRLGAYMHRNPKRNVLWRRSNNSSHQYSEYLRPDSYIYAVTFCRRLFQNVTIMSDGLQSFRSATGLIAKDHELASELLAFRSHKGQFVTRRARRMLKRHQERGLRPLDDFSAATICGCTGAIT